MIRHTPGILARAGLAVAAVLAAPLASAAIVTGSWDPLLPPPFVSLGWVATVNMQVNDNCIRGADGKSNVLIFGEQFGCDAVPKAKDFEVLRAQVGIYSTVTGAIIDVLDFAPPGGPLGPDLDDLGSDLFRVSLNLSSTVPGEVTGTSGFLFKFEIPEDLPVLLFKGVNDPASGPFTAAPNVPIRTLFDVQPDENLAAVLAGTVLSVGQVVVDPTAVPEPGSLALALLALGAAGAVASRRQRRGD